MMTSLTDNDLSYVKIDGKKIHEGDMIWVDEYSPTDFISLVSQFDEVACIEKIDHDNKILIISFSGFELKCPFDKYHELIGWIAPPKIEDGKINKSLELNTKNTNKLDSELDLIDINITKRERIKDSFREIYGNKLIGSDLSDLDLNDLWSFIVNPEFNKENSRSVFWFEKNKYAILYRLILRLTRTEEKLKNMSIEISHIHFFQTNKILCIQGKVFDDKGKPILDFESKNFEFKGKFKKDVLEPELIISKVEKFIRNTFSIICSFYEYYENPKTICL